MTADTGGAPSGARPKAAEAPRTLQRRVYYVAGFDPASAKKYHRLYAEQSQLQGALTGVGYEVGELLPIDLVTSGWTVRATHPGGQVVEVDYRVLHWFEQVREVWPKDEPRLFLRFFQALKDYRQAGLLSKAKAESRVVWLTALAPSVLALGFALIFGLIVALLMTAGAGVAAMLKAPWPLGALPPLALLLLLMPLWRRFDALLPVGWAGRGMIGVTRAARGLAPGLAAQSLAFANRLAAAESEGGFDEILVVGHSMGAQQACRALGRAVMLNPRLGKLRRVRLLTLGSLLPFYSMTEAEFGGDPDFREEMAALVEADWIDWLDITAPSDPGCAASLHPLLGLGLGEPEERPFRRSPRFGDIVTPERLRRLKRTPLDYHFQYIMAGELGGEYDFFALTAGPEPITRMVLAEEGA
jgi:hypothetical protein